MKKKYLATLLFLCVFTIFGTTSAEALSSLGSIADNLLGAASNVEHIVKALCITTGVAMILGSMFQYRKYRKNPIEVPLGKVIMTFIIGAILVIITFIPFQV